MKKSLFIFFIVVLLATGCNSSLKVGNVMPAVSPTPTSVSQNAAPVDVDCQNYKNYGIELTCPAGFYIQDFKDATAYGGLGATYLSFYNKTKTYIVEESDVSPFGITVSKDVYGGSATSYLKAIPNSGLSLGQQTTLGGVTAYVLTPQAGADGSEGEEIVFSNGNLYEFYYEHAVSGVLSTYNAILASVKFY